MRKKLRRSANGQFCGTNIQTSADTDTFVTETQASTLIDNVIDNHFDEAAHIDTIDCDFETVNQIEDNTSNDVTLPAELSNTVTDNNIKLVDRHYR